MDFERASASSTLPLVERESTGTCTRVHRGVPLVSSAGETGRFFVEKLLSFQGRGMERERGGGRRGREEERERERKGEEDLKGGGRRACVGRDGGSWEASVTIHCAKVSRGRMLGD